MGYTHYHNGLIFTDAKWEKLRRDVRKLLKSLPETVKVQREYNKATRPLVGKDAIAFNGVGEEGHETFWLPKEHELFSFTKTARKPYDLAVCCVLMLASIHAEGKYSEDDGIASDGINAAHGQWPDNVDQEWKDAWKHFHSIFPKVDKEMAFRMFKEKEMICRLIDA